MRSEMFSQANVEVQSSERWVRQSDRMLKVSLGADVLAAKGAMVAYQGQVTFQHEGAGSMGKLLKKVLTSEDNPLMRVAGQGELFFARLSEHIFLIQLEGDGISINGSSLLVFDATLTWDIHRVQGAGMMTGGVFNTGGVGSGDGGDHLRRSADDPRLLPAADLRRHPGHGGLVDQPQAAGGQQHEHALDAARRLRAAAGQQNHECGSTGGAVRPPGRPKAGRHAPEAQSAQQPICRDR